MNIKLLTLNIHKGFSLTKQRITIADIKKNIVASGANIVCLQEVVGAHPSLETGSQFEFLADEIWPHFAYGKNAISSNGHHGNAILSLFPFLKSQNFNISNYRLEQRGILHGVVHPPDFPSNELHIMTLHLDLMSWGRKRQVDRLCQLVEEHIPPNAPLIICGDFNDWREELSPYLFNKIGVEEAHLNQTGVHAKTFPTFMPLLKLDRIYSRNITIDHITRLDSPSWHQLSDHLPLYAEF